MDLQSHATSVQKLQFFSFPLIIKRELTYAVTFLIILLFSLFLLLSFIHPFHPQSIFRKSLVLELLQNNQYSASRVCDYSKGRWVRDDNHSFELYNEECPFLDPGFRCHQNGRKDEDYIKWQWKPEGCDLPRFNAIELLERCRNGRIVLAGDSIGRNQWESLVCMLAQGISNKSTIFEENGNPITKHKGYLSIRFNTYNLTIEYYRVPFLVSIDRPPPNSSDQIRSAIRVDQLHWRSRQWIGADVLVFNTGHWWNQDKTVNMGHYFQEGGEVNMTMDVMEAFQRSVQTWKSWVMQNFNTEKSHVFFRSYSPAHFRDGTWNEGGYCDSNTEPETNYTNLEAEPWNNLFIYKTIEQMNNAKRNVHFLNITYLTELRKDGHPSIHREPGTPIPLRQDCSHWCLPGVPDTWNKLLYGHLLSKGYRIKKS